MRNRFFIFSMFSLFIIGLLLVVLIGTTSQIVQAYTPPLEIHFYRDMYYSGDLVGYWIKDCDNRIYSNGKRTSYPDVHPLACNK